MTGRSTRQGGEELRRHLRRLVEGDGRVRLGLEPLEGLTMEHALDAMDRVYGWDGTGPRARIEPARTVEGWLAGCVRVLEVAAQRGRIAFATGRPASLLALHQALAAAAIAAGGSVAEHGESPALADRRRRLWWVHGVAAVTDGESLLADDGLDAAASSSSPSTGPTSSWPTACSRGWPSARASRWSR